MNIRVNPTRMELLRLKKRVSVAKRGHKLLKDKRDELMKSFLVLVREARDLRAEVDEKLTSAYRSFRGGPRSDVAGDAGRGHHVPQAEDQPHRPAKSG